MTESITTKDLLTQRRRIQNLVKTAKSSEEKRERKEEKRELPKLNLKRNPFKSKKGKPVIGFKASSSSGGFLSKYVKSVKVGSGK